MRFQSAHLPRAAQNRSRPPPKKKPRTKNTKKKNKNRQGREAHQVGKAPRRLTRFGFFISRRRQQPAHRQAFINPGSLNARPAGMEPGAGRFRQPAILGADLVFAYRMRAAIRRSNRPDVRARSAAQARKPEPRRADRRKASFAPRNKMPISPIPAPRPARPQTRRHVNEARHSFLEKTRPIGRPKLREKRLRPAQKTRPLQKNHAESSRKPIFWPISAALRKN